VLKEQCAKWERCPTIHRRQNCGQGKLMIMKSGDQIITEGKEDVVMWDVGGKRGMHTEFWWGNHLEDLGVDGKIIFKCIFKI